jgi:putative ABC transport system permease protein
MTDLWQDLLFSLRALKRRRGATAVLLVSLILGIGMVSAVFSVVDAVLLQALPYKDPARLVQVSGFWRRGAKVDSWPLSYLDFRDWSERGRAFLVVGAYSKPLSFTLEQAGRADHLEGEMVSASYFQLLGMSPALGRIFSEAEDKTTDPRYVVILGHDLWRRRFGGDRQVVGRHLLLDGASYEVVGVMPPGARGASDTAQIWLPLNMAAQLLDDAYIGRRGLRWLEALGRLPPGTTLAGAQAGLDAVTAALRQEYPRTNQGIGARLIPLQEAWAGNLRQSLLLVFSGAALVLLMACANVASLLLTQAMERRQELSVRTALGASRPRLVRQLLTESLLLSLLGGAGGLLFALAATRLLDWVQAAGLRSFVHAGLNARVAGFTLGVSLLCGAGFGLAPLWVAWRTDVASVLKEGTRGSPRQRLQSVLVAGEVALALALLVATGLTVRGFQRLQATSLGYRTDVLTLRLDIGDKRYAEYAVLSLLRRLDESIGAQPGVQAVALEGPGLPTVSSDEAAFSAENLDPAQDMAFSLFMHHVSPGYFSTLGVPLLAGRLFTAHDDQHATPWSVVVDAATARRIWPGQSALGKLVKIGRRDNQFPWFRVIGVVGDARHLGLATDRDQWRQEARDVYFTALQFPPKWPPQVNILARPAPGIDAAALVEPVRRGVAAVDVGLVPFDDATLAARLEKQTARPRLLVRLMALFSLLALVLAVVGIHGMVANSVVRRTREIGIRIALGADRGAVIGWIVKHAALLALVGAAAGLAAAAVIARLMVHHLYGIPAIDLPAFCGASLLLLGIAVLTSWLAAHRASRIEPSAALRAE